MVSPLRVFGVIVSLAALSAGGTIAALQEQDPPRQTFRTGVNLVRLDVLVTDAREQPMTDLTQADFEVLEDGRIQQIEQFRLVRIDGNPDPRNPLPERIRSFADETMIVDREDVRVFAIFLDDYHIGKLNWTGVRDELIRFVRTEFRPNDLVAVMDPSTPVRALEFTRDPEVIVSALRAFEGRRGEYFPPRNAYEEQYVFRGAGVAERVRNEVTITALQGLAVRLGSLREGRKSIIFVSEGVSAGPGSSLELMLRDIYRDANRYNASIYPVDPRRGPARLGRWSQEMLRTLALETGGRAVQFNRLTDGLKSVVRDASQYYLLGYSSSTAVNDGKFHEVTVRVKRRGATVHARKGYWAMTAADAARAANPTIAVITPAQQSLKALPAADANAYLYRWIGVSRGTDGRMRVTIVWEPKPDRNRRASQQPGRIGVTVTTDDGKVLFQDGTAAQAAFSATSGSPGHAYVFDSAPGKREVRLTVEAATDGETIDRDLVSVDVPDLTAPEAISTARVFRGRTVNEFRSALAGGTTPSARRDFLRSDRLLIRFDTQATEVTASLINATGRKLGDITVSRTQTEGTHQIDLNLGALIHGEYVVEITAGTESEFVPFRIIG